MELAAASGKGKLVTYTSYSPGSGDGCRVWRALASVGEGWRGLARVAGLGGPAWGPAIGRGVLLEPIGEGDGAPSPRGHASVSAPGLYWK